MKTIDMNGVKIVDYKNISIDEWKDIILSSIEKCEKMWADTMFYQSKADFENTFLKLEVIRSELMKPWGNFQILVDGGDKEAMDLYEELSPLISKMNAKQLSNKKMAERCQRVMDEKKDTWPEYQKRMAENWLLKMKMSGAFLNDADKKEIIDIAGELSTLESKFSQLLSQSCDGVVLFTSEEIDGVEKGKLNQNENGEYVVRLMHGEVMEIMENCNVRDSRKKILQAYKNRGTQKDIQDIQTQKVILEILNLRKRKSKILGYRNFTEMALTNTMAKDKVKVENLIKGTWNNYIHGYKNIIEKINNHKNTDIDIEPWDVYYYLNKINDDKNQGNENKDSITTLKQVRDAAFKASEKLFSLGFEKQNISGPWVGSETWVVKKHGRAIGGLVTDYASRDGKANGAWMHLLSEGFGMNERQLAVVANTCSFGSGKDDEKLTAYDVQTFFHEFGHALHGLLGQSYFPSQSGTNTLNDWVEVPSQLFEHWVKDKDTASKLGLDENSGGGDDEYAHVIEKIAYLQSAWLDIKLHQEKDEITDIEEWEKETLKELTGSKGVKVLPHHRLSHFSHLFSGEQYASGYYGYLWSETLDNQIWEKVAKKEPLTKQVGQVLENYLYGAGDSLDPNVLMDKMMESKIKLEIKNDGRKTKIK